MSAINLVSYESATTRKWTGSWCIGYKQALTKSIELIDRVRFDAMLTGVKVEVALDDERKELVRKLALVDLFMSKH